MKTKNIDMSYVVIYHSHQNLNDPVGDNYHRPIILKFPSIR